MNKEYRVNREKCVGCGSCVIVCPGGTEIDAENKAKILSNAKIEECGGEVICAYGAIEEVNGVGNEETEE